MKYGAAKKALTKRQLQWKQMESQLIDKARSRYSAGGYRCPGSCKKK